MDNNKETKDIKNTNEVDMTSKVQKEEKGGAPRPNSTVNKPGKGKFYVKSKITLAMFIAVILVVLVALIMIIVNIFKPEPVPNKTMDAYGFSKLYDSGTSNENETVTRSEAIKMMVAAILNVDDITDYIEPSLFLENYIGVEDDIKSLLEYDNQAWVEYAKAINITNASTITKENESDKVSYIEILENFADAKRYMLLQELDSTDKEYNVNNLTTYNASQQVALKDMIENGIIPNQNENFRKNATKKELNDVIVNFVNEYNTITLDNEKININPEKIPANADEYPYTLASVDKSVYERENYKADGEGYKTPIDYYSQAKQYYQKINDVINLYLNTILNVNYESLDENAFYENIKQATQGNVSEDFVKQYLQKVKDNHIKITGNAKIQFPAVYYDGEATRVRTKIEYSIDSADTLENILFGDDYNVENKIEYSGENVSGLFDIPVNIFENANRVVIEALTLDDAKLGSIKRTVVKNESTGYTGNSTDESTSSRRDYLGIVSP